MNRTSLALRTAAVCTALLSLSAAAVGWMVLGAVERAGSSTIVSATTFDTLDRTIDVSVATTESVGDALDDLDRLTALVSDSSETTAEFVDGVAELTSERIPDSLRAVEDSLPALISAGGVVDDTLSALTLFGVDYDPEVRFDAALRRVDASLDGLADDVAAQGRQLSHLAPEVREVGVTADDLGLRIAETRDRLTEAADVLTEYRLILDETRTSLTELAGPVRMVPLARALLVVVGIAGLGVAAAAWVLGSPARVYTHAPERVGRVSDTRSTT